ncbi:ABC transporter ATP-binding protein [Erythrobacter sp.]|uniref:ABC transporter ATP-binding protein n=1 Tax=Erythrobacter sp. TaxID=1042 RepID=UPI0014260163|nr:ABC transporter ATP-binding protein [Erythrobacter sp.]QIQ88038.1 MAG: ABC transporter ATP-binding protein [Erythrobacter sp.]
MQALRDISLVAPAGEITCLLGSSGCGKSTLLSLAAGLLPVQQGAILLGGEVLADETRAPPPEKRPVGLVFQEGALFPHMTLARNIAFGLPKARHGEIAGWLDQVGLAGLGSRYPHELSGGQQQRAALARAMAPGPAVLLMDEPFASVDIVLRRSLRRDCRMLLKERGATTILVTHDPGEALDIGDRIAVMEAGRIVQFGSPEELHEAPAAASVGAMFSGAQVVPAERRGEALATPFGDWPAACVIGPVPDAARLELLVHARALDLVPDAAGLPVRDVHGLGDGRVRVLLGEKGGRDLAIEAGEAPSPGERFRVVPQTGSVRAFAAG